MDEIIGNSKNIKEAREKVKLYALYEENILIKGPTGTGKNLLAEKIHKSCSRKNHPFLLADCGCMTETLFMSELYGHKKGAFTGAIEDRKGLFLEAEQGILLLDGIENLPLVLQPSLLTAVEEKRIKRVGENFHRKVNVRIISTSNKDLEKLAKEGEFREDLYFRLHTLSIYLAPLKERREDIIELAKYHLYKLNKAYGEKRRLHPDVVPYFVSYPWPGNVRELNNMISYIYIHSMDIISIESLPEKVRNCNPEKNTIIPDSLSIPEILFQQMVNEGKSFWVIVHKPFLKRELNRREVKEVIALGLNQTKGSYKKLLPLFNLGHGEKDYKRSMGVIRKHNLRID